MYLINSEIYHTKIYIISIEFYLIMLLLLFLLWRRNFVGHHSHSSSYCCEIIQFSCLLQKIKVTKDIHKITKNVETSWIPMSLVFKISLILLSASRL